MAMRLRRLTSKRFYQAVYQLPDQARYQVEGGRLKGVGTDDEVSVVLHGRALEEGLRMVKESKDKVTGKNKQE